VQANIFYVFEYKGGDYTLMLDVKLNYKVKLEKEDFPSHVDPFKSEVVYRTEDVCVEDLKSAKLLSISIYDDKNEDYAEVPLNMIENLIPIYEKYFERIYDMFKNLTSTSKSMREYGKSRWKRWQEELKSKSIYEKGGETVSEHREEITFADFIEHSRKEMEQEIKSGIEGKMELGAVMDHIEEKLNTAHLYGFNEGREFATQNSQSPQL